MPTPTPNRHGTIVFSPPVHNSTTPTPPSLFDFTLQPQQTDAVLPSGPHMPRLVTPRQATVVLSKFELLCAQGAAGEAALRTTAQGRAGAATEVDVTSSPIPPVALTPPLRLPTDHPVSLPSPPPPRTPPSPPTSPPFSSSFFPLLRSRAPRCAPAPRSFLAFVSHSAASPHLLSTHLALTLTPSYAPPFALLLRCATSPPPTTHASCPIPLHSLPPPHAVLYVTPIPPWSPPTFASPPLARKLLSPHFHRQSRPIHLPISTPPFPSVPVHSPLTTTSGATLPPLPPLPGKFHP
ncbi:unnamed protein product [Dicrocoelium dendriticum]|nr:unnamed protein product [Dicrocoelium dendriticum]